MISYDSLSDCALCPRECHVDRRAGPLGYCNTDDSFLVSSVCIHQGEEPVISGDKGICNVFFGHCNLQCIYCQNHQISDNSTPLISNATKPDIVINKIISILESGIGNVGFVSPSHMIPQMVQIIDGIRNRGFRPVFVYNSNGYDKPRTLRELEGIIDVWLPDLKYLDGNIANRFSDAPDYPEVAASALKEMYRQKGSYLHLDDNGVATSGILIRHLVLPGYVENSIRVLEFIAKELSSSVSVSLMSQYYPIRRMSGHKSLGRTLYLKEYQEVIQVMERLGLEGYIQEMTSQEHYRPDFQKAHPFE